MEARVHRTDHCSGQSDSHWHLLLLDRRSAETAIYRIGNVEKLAPTIDYGYRYYGCFSKMVYVKTVG